MNKKNLLLLILPVIAIIVVFTFNQALTEDRLPCFSGITYVDGVATSEVLVTLRIGGLSYEVTSYTDGYQEGVYKIGRLHDTGDYCLKAVYGTGQTGDWDARWGVKSSSGTITLDLYLHSQPEPECQEQEP